MNAFELRNVQSPLKERYASQPESALLTLQSQGNIGEGISCTIATGQAMVEAGLHPVTGGNGLQACSGNLLLDALVACAGVTLTAVATAIGVTITGGVVKAEGDLDFRGTLGVSKEAPVGFKQIRLSFHFESNATEEQMASLAKLTERYCVVYQTISGGVKIETAYHETTNRS